MNMARSLVCLEVKRFVVFLQNASKLKLNAERLGNWQLLSGAYEGLTFGSKTCIGIQRL